MVALADWLKEHQDRLVAAGVQQLSERDVLRQQVEAPVRWFFDRLLEALVSGEQSRLELLLRGWVNLCTLPINNEPIGLLPVLGVLKTTIWREFQADPPAAESILPLALELDAVMTRCAEFLSKVEAAALFELAAHMLAAQQRPVPDEDADTGGFISVAAHELKTPLTVIEGYTNMLKLRLDDPHLMLMVRGIESGIVRLRELVEDLIDASLVEAGLLKFESQPIWLTRLLAIAEFEVAEVLGQRRITLEIKRETLPSRPTVGDPERLLQAMRKVLANAIKYTPDGGRVIIWAREMSGFVDLVIEDTGIGIAPENLERIFRKAPVIEDISRHSSSKTGFKGGGPGLGLVIARGIIEGQGGTIWAESPGFDEEACPGSRFHLVLPLRDALAGEGLPPLVAGAMQRIAEQRMAAASEPQAEVAQAVEVIESVTVLNGIEVLAAPVGVTEGKVDIAAGLEGVTSESVGTEADAGPRESVEKSPDVPVATSL